MSITREQAAAWFETMHPPGPAAREMYRMAAKALRPVSREQVERMRGEWRECFEDWRKQIAGDQCSKCGFQHYGTSINHYHFCPACGAPMTDEALEMVMERINKMEGMKK